MLASCIRSQQLFFEVNPAVSLHGRAASTERLMSLCEWERQRWERGRVVSESVDLCEVCECIRVNNAAEADLDLVIFL